MQRWSSGGKAVRVGFLDMEFFFHEVEKDVLILSADGAVAVDALVVVEGGS